MLTPRPFYHVERGMFHSLIKGPRLAAAVLARRLVLIDVRLSPVGYGLVCAVDVKDAVNTELLRSYVHIFTYIYTYIKDVQEPERNA